jgi:hypothetical protein
MCDDNNADSDTKKSTSAEFSLVKDSSSMVYFWKKRQENSLVVACSVY